MDGRSTHAYQEYEEKDDFSTQVVLAVDSEIFEVVYFHVKFSHHKSLMSYACFLGMIFKRILKTSKQF
jgi:hypothetical protein